MILVLGATAQPAAAQCGGHESISLQPTVGPPTSEVLVAGTGFGATEQVTVDFDSTVVGSIVTDSSRVFSITITVPVSALPGSHPVTATGQKSGLTATRNFLVRTDWPEFHFDPAQSGFNPYENVIGPANVSTLTTAWTAAAAIGFTESLVVANGVAYITASGTVYAFDASGITNCSGTPTSCTPLWTGATDGQLNGYGSPVVANGVVYVGASSPGGNVFGFDAAGNTNCSGTPKTCNPVWFGSTGGDDILGSPAVANGVLYAGSYTGTLYAFNATGTFNCGGGTPTFCVPLWTASTTSSIAEIASGPSVANGVVYVGSGQNLYAFDAAGVTNCSDTGPPSPQGAAPKTCTPLWTATTGGYVGYSSPAVANGVVYIGSWDHNFYAFDASGKTNCSGTPTTCEPLWTAAMASGERISSSPAVANGLVYVGSGTFSSGHLYAFDASGSTNCSGSPTTRTPLWTWANGESIDSSPAVANGVVYVGSSGGNGNLYAFSP